MLDYYNDDEIVLIRSSEIIKIVRSALGKIDARLIEHGERVGYIAAKTAEESRDRSYFDPSKLFVFCALHDIGAYKTEEIDNMVRFETESVSEHSLYGYLFLKNTTHLSEYAEAILFHHTDYSSPELGDCQYAKYAELIHLADRADILISSASGRLDALRSYAGNKFNPEYVKALFAAEEKHHISEKLKTGGFLTEYAAIADKVEISSSETMDYLKLLVYAIDFRRPYTVTHTADTTIISLETGKLLGLPQHELQAMYIGAFLHDIGKIAIPHSIIEKPGRLTDEEFDIVKRHIPEGELILRGVIRDEICDIALRHHEKMDGSGYFAGLTASELTIPQCIVAVADILSALSQKRSYKEPFPKEKVIGILNEMKEKGQLCPLVVDTVCNNYDHIIRCTETSHDPVKTLYSELLTEYSRRTSRSP